MRTLRRAVVVFLCWGMATAAIAADTLDVRVDAILKSPGYGNGQWGLLVTDAKTGQVVFEKNADQLFCPASVTKLFSCAAAMSELGGDFRFNTPVVRRGEIDANGTLKGDLILVASGDLSLGGRTGPDGSLLFEDNDHSYAGGNLKATLVKGDPRAGLDHLAREIKERGIKMITGDVVIDARLFDPAQSTGSGPSRVSPIVINDNVIDVVVSPGAKVGDSANVKIVPDTKYASFDARVTTVSEGGSPSIVVESVGNRRFTVTGRLPVGHRPIVKIYDIEEPASFARALFIEALRAQGIQLECTPLGENSYDMLSSRADVLKWPRVAEYTSPPLKEYVRVILKVSQNLHASTLPLLIAAHHGETTLDQGLRREGDALKKLGVDINSIAFGGGAGGARADLVTPRATAALLRAMSLRPDFAAYDNALPVLGRDGTLATAVSPESPARGHVRAKTGTYWLSNGLNGHAVLTSKALAGYMETSSGRPLIFAFFLNNVSMAATGDEQVTEAAAATGKLLGKLCEAFYLENGEAPPTTKAP